MASLISSVGVRDVAVAPDGPGEPGRPAVLPLSLLDDEGVKLWRRALGVDGAWSREEAGGRGDDMVADSNYYLGSSFIEAFFCAFPSSLFPSSSFLVEMQYWR